MRRLVVGLAALVVAVPAANAAPDERGADGAEGAAFAQGIQPRPEEGALGAYEAAQPPDTPAGNPRALPSDDGARPVQVVVRPDGGGFDWGDAFAGAGVAFGLVLVGAAAARATRHLTKPASA